MATVELHQAFVWTCEECGSDNFCRCVTADFASDEERERVFRHFMELEDYEPLPEGWREFTLTTAPLRVECGKCAAEFDTQDQRQADDEDVDS